MVRLESEPVIDVFRLFRPRELKAGVRAARNDPPAELVEVCVVGKLVAEGLRGRKPTCEPDIDEPFVGDRREGHAEVDRRARFKLAVGRHVHRRSSIDVLARPWLEREVDPAELLERRLG